MGIKKVEDPRAKKLVEIQQMLMVVRDPPEEKPRGLREDPNKVKTLEGKDGGDAPS